MIDCLFWVALMAVIYTYFGYGLLLFLVSRFKHKDVKKLDITPTVSLIITVYNAEKTVASKIEDTLALHYPREKLQVIVASDCSTDSTDEIVSRYRNEGVELLRLPERRGKTEAQNLAIKHARGEIIAFTDSSARIEAQSLAHAVKNFGDESVGCVTSEDRDRDAVRGQGENLYVRYGTALRRMESRVDSTIGASGSFYAVDRSIALELAPGLARDFASSLLAKKHGLRAINEPSAWVHVANLGSVNQEFRRKLRTVVRGLTVLFTMKELLNPFRYGFYSFQLMSHKLFKWLAPFFLLIMVIASVGNFGAMLSRVVLALTALFWSSAIIGATIDSLSLRNRWLAVPAYVGAGILAVVIGWILYLSGGRRAYWEPTRREKDAGEAR